MLPVVAFHSKSKRGGRRRLICVVKDMAWWLHCLPCGIFLAAPYLIPRLLGRIIIEGKAHLELLPPQRENVLFVANHPSMVDAHIITTAISWPAYCWNPNLFLWQTPDKKTFRWVIPLIPYGRYVVVRKDASGRRNDSGAYRKLLKILPRAPVLIFPEGGRSRNAVKERGVCYKTVSGIELGYPRLGVGGLIEATNPWVVPILLKGVEAYHPIERRFPNFFAPPHMRLIIGRPIRGLDLLIGLTPSDGRKHNIRFLYADAVIREIVKLDSAP